MLIKRQRAGSLVTAHAQQLPTGLRVQCACPPAVSVWVQVPDESSRLSKHSPHPLTLFPPLSLCAKAGWNGAAAPRVFQGEAAERLHLFGGGVGVSHCLERSGLKGEVSRPGAESGMNCCRERPGPLSPWAEEEYI
ncbi:hypothetical protein chiPu_0016156 [Chiloscyllium punctatum]|uniref:Uncharacterized protein n=1 Tax=Chiloscyllium punctatum TaxID=137246 RepID=A0A401T4P9_CHIPU|nr:hypothetical protein [Chiloscyllium punctatum]